MVEPLTEGSQTAASGSQWRIYEMPHGELLLIIAPNSDEAWAEALNDPRWHGGPSQWLTEYVGDTPTGLEIHLAERVHRPLYLVH